MRYEELKEVKISELLGNKYEIFAHKMEDLRGQEVLDKGVLSKGKELLEEHIDLCHKYLKKLWKEGGITTVLGNFEEIFLQEASKEDIKLFEQLFLSTITFHDIGKINPLFQAKNMDNILPVNMEVMGKLGSSHSSISSALYIDYFLEEVSNLSLNIRKKLRLILLINGYVISRHHSALNSFENFLEGIVDPTNTTLCIHHIAHLMKEYFFNIYNREMYLDEKIVRKTYKNARNYLRELSETCQEEEDHTIEVYIYGYARFLHSILVTCDYYATTEYMNGLEVNDIGSIRNISSIYKMFQETEVNKKIKQYKEVEYQNNNRNLSNETNINVMRNELFLESEENLKRLINEDIFFLEAPTGSGKSNTAMNLSLLLAGDNTKLNKIYYVYPFNTLVEQNKKILYETFDKSDEIYNQIAVVNALTPIKINQGIEECKTVYSKALLDRQFMNYPIVLTTHVTLFDLMFGNGKDSSFGFHQFTNSIIVLDEIQSYKNTIWTEIIIFLKAYAKLMNIKVIIMSATLPDLNLLLDSKREIPKLILNREKYFSNVLFKNRVHIDYELLKEKITMTELIGHLKRRCERKKVLIEFIKKKSAYEFYQMLQDELYEEGINIELMTGDDNQLERERIINSIKESKEGVILVATQVIEAGVDIDMDIGYKDISKLDSEEQFMGRINRSCKREGEVYFFQLDSANKIYNNDFRTNREFTLLEDSMKDILEKKNFYQYYEPVMKEIIQYNKSSDDSNIDIFYNSDVLKLNFGQVSNRMKLIEEDDWSMRVFLCQKLQLTNNKMIDGHQVWDEYKELLADTRLEFAKKQVLLSRVMREMNYFIYEIKKNQCLSYNEQIGNIFCIFDGEQYFTNGKLNREKFENQIGIFL